ncbi:alpha/beta hydrolase [Solirubrobacter sp. CPCC 204708]|uniref:Alpha/beta hydrolase n=1 Tax=Solirubrobacter deserti TaxID=2282478 RepID=A0ABT4RMZ2_9ACTN|nr:alpha/beta hydrolase [Solirubrobacter deserti]MBE2317992.1 alpha/beta hydrolase [Solirubrobacter deserti]MDA0139671.1 alpha/beta hydrolase [Solirubrobacter deserti]
MNPPALEGVTHHYVDLPNGLRVHVAEHGEGPPVLALHGFPQHWYQWRRLFAALPDHRIIAPDLRGLGWTSAAPDGDYRKATIAADQIALLDALELEKVILVGHDWGGWVGWHLALDHPDRFHGYVAAGIVHPFNTPQKLLRELPRFLYQPPIAAPVLGPLLIPHVVTRFLRGAWGDRETYDRAAEPIYVERYRTTAGAGSQYYRQFLTREVLRGPSGRLTLPTRLLQGRRDPIGTALAQGLDRHGDDAITLLLDGCGHFVPEERPADIAAAVRSLPWS